MVLYYNMTMEEELVASLTKRPPNITVLAGDGSVLASRGMRRDYVRLGQLPEHLIQAVLSTEDRRFYWHFGIDPLGLARAFYINLRAGQVVEGGSTITQQLAKNVFLNHKRTYARKLREAMLAVWLETQLSKDEILEQYLNRVYFGAGAHGVAAAAQRYFGKYPHTLSLSESAILAGLLKAPSRLSPLRNMDLAQMRANAVLENMVDTGAITRVQANYARTHPPKLKTGVLDDISDTSYVLDWIMESLPGFVGEVGENLQIRTTIDPGMQRAAQRIVYKIMRKHGAPQHASQAAAVFMDTGGAIKAIVGGTSYTKSQFNRAIKAKRQPGSSFKPFVYLAALEGGLHPASIVEASRIRIGSWTPRNYTRQYSGAVTLREGLAHSINTVAARLMQDMGRSNVVRVARRMGITSPLHNKPSLALGTAEVTPLELTGAYVPFANGGIGVIPHGIIEVRTENGKALYRRKGSGPGRIIEQNHVAQMQQMMRAVLTEGTGRSARIKRHPAAGKTGTTQGFRDAWFVGYTAYYVGGVWVGNDSGKPMRKVTGGSLPARIWKGIMQAAHRDLPARPLNDASAPVATSAVTHEIVEPQVRHTGLTKQFLEDILNAPVAAK